MSGNRDAMARALLGFGHPGSLRYETAVKPLAQNLGSEFQRDMHFAPGWREWRRDFIKNVGGQPNTEPGGDYNYRLAWLSGATPETDPGTGEVHGFSSARIPPFKDPVGLKSDNHPTMWKETFMKKFQANPDVVSREGTATPEMKEFINDQVRQSLLKALIGQ